MIRSREPNIRKVLVRLLRIRRLLPLCHRERILACILALIGLRWDIRTRMIRFTRNERVIMPVRWCTVAIVALLAPQDFHVWEELEAEEDTVAGSTTAIGKMGTMTTAIARILGPGPDLGVEVEAGLVVVGLAVVAAGVAQAAAVAAAAEAAAGLAAAVVDRVLAVDDRAVEVPVPSRRRNRCKCPNQHPST